ncbi:hypothetical protein QBC34DRAFT_492310 [Podospora aff. communis PSN243]|uniref:Uncharacterized protein n=1 Tax=Podospora aff. communis PSN243 TaxID=3040156 RepID=A0AAV9GWD3_9PEZI|nr:hypothetical protein QBC34DRAFT_492310 [Podospora aff. communis PSN243]
MLLPAPLCSIPQRGSSVSRVRNVGLRILSVVTYLAVKVCRNGMERAQRNRCQAGIAKSCTCERDSRTERSTGERAQDLDQRQPSNNALDWAYTKGNLDECNSSTTNGPFVITAGLRRVLGPARAESGKTNDEGKIRWRSNQSRISGSDHAVPGVAADIIISAWVSTWIPEQNGRARRRKAVEQQDGNLRSLVMSSSAQPSPRLSPVQWPPAESHPNGGRSIEPALTTQSRTRNGAGAIDPANSTTPDGALWD